MKAPVKIVLRTFGIPEYIAALRRSITTYTFPNSYDIEFSSQVVRFLTDRAYTKEWFHRNRGAHKGWHEPSITFLLEHLAESSSTFVDVGSHLGYFSILFSSIVGNKSLAVELDPSNFEELSRAVAFQPTAIRERIAIVHCGVSDGAGTIELPAKRALSPSHSMPRAGYTWSRRAKVHIVTLDELVQSRAFAPDIIKIDVEGSEFNVLTGAAQVLSMFKPLLIIEVHPEHVSKIGHDPSLISAFLQDRGYMIYSFDDHRSTGVSSLTEIRKITKAHDHVIVCVHQSDSARRLSLTATGLIRRSNSE